jgi:hypothetical protein
MILNSVIIEDKVDLLLGVLDMDIEQISYSLACLGELRGLLIKRDDKSLSELLEVIRERVGANRVNESRRQELIVELALSADCDVKQMTLSYLVEICDGDRRAKVIEKRGKLRELALELKREHCVTALLLRECSRINGMLLRSIIKRPAGDVLTYDSSGYASRGGANAFINLKF